LQRIVLSLAALFLVWLAGLGAFVMTLPGASRSQPEQADGVIVYTGGGGARIIAGMSLLETGAGKRLLISGVNPSVTRDTIAELWSGPRELFDCCVDLGLEAQTTIGNAGEAAEWASTNKIGRIILVTSDFHMPRALTETRMRMRSAEITPYVVASGYLDGNGRPLSLKAWEKLAGEYTKYLIAKAKAFFSFFQP